MIIVLIVIFTIASFVCWMYLKPVILRWVTGLISLGLLLASVLLLIGNFSWNWGTKTVTKTTTRPIYSAGNASSPNMIYVFPLGTASDNDLIAFADSQGATAKVHFSTVPFALGTDMQKEVQTYLKNNSIEAIKKSSSYQLTAGGKATVQTVTTRRVFSSNLMKTLFGVGGGENALVSEKTTVSIPKDTWLALNAKQLAELQSLAPALLAKEQAAQKQLEAALAAAPTPEAKAAILAQAKAAQAAAQTPEAKVATVKAALGIQD